MTRQGFLIGFLVGGWLATLAVVLVPLALPGAGPAVLPAAHAEDPPTTAPAQPFGPNGPILPGPSVNPIDEVRGRGGANPGANTSDSNNRAIALSASIGGGESVVYYFDTVARRLCVYQYRGGSRGGLRLLAARYIDFDLRLEQYRDLSEKTPAEMREMYEAAMGAGASDRDPLPTRRVDLPGGIR